MNLNDITIRTDLRPGDLGFIMHRHGVLYHREYGYGVTFEVYVGEGIAEFYRKYDPDCDRVWVCEQKERIVGFLLLMHREKGVAQLRYFYIEPEWRGIGLGKKLMALYMEFLVSRNYRSSYLWTTNEQTAAASLYMRHGFRLTAEKESSAFGKPLQEQRYDLAIGGVLP
jgi:ribosomal protein S18 acetylase RimI-like enzyme